MKQLFYTISYLKNAWGNNLIKVFTLTLGLAIGLILFARISFDLSYDKFLPDAENIYQVQMIYTTGVGTNTSHSTEQCYSFQPIAPTMPLEIPGVVAGTSTTGNGERVILGKTVIRSEVSLPTRCSSKPFRLKSFPVTIWG